MSTSYKVQFWEHRHRADRRKPYMVRWTVAGREFSESFLTKTQADGRKAQLITAARAGEPFDVDRGLPLSELRTENAVTWYQHGLNYVKSRWDGGMNKVLLHHRERRADAEAGIPSRRCKIPATEVGRGGYQSTAAPQPKTSCYSCHAEHAGRDNVFVQFYGLLKEATPRGK